MVDTVPGGARTVDLATERAAIDVFCDAVEQDPATLEAWLVDRCAGQSALLARVRELLEADAAASAPAPAFEQTWVGNRGLRPMPPPPAQVGPYRLDELIGTGGMGAVYRAHRNDGLFDQQVAVKFVRSFAAPGQVDALIDAERRLLARMQHPGIARILDGGHTDQGTHYLVMEFVEGVPLDEHVAGQQADLAAQVALMRQVCAAVAHAHGHGVIHNDLKPANILVTADGQVKLIDFGVARLKDVLDAELPQGYTPGYTSPQRIAGGPPTAADDVFSLGVVMCQLSTGVAPGPTPPAPDPVALGAELAAIARKALATDPLRRYAVVTAFDDDLQRWNERRPVSAMPDDWHYRLRKLVQRRPWRVAAAGAASLGLLASLLVIGVLYARAEAARVDAEHRFAELRELANYMLFDLDRRLEMLPGTTASRRELVGRGQKYLDALGRTTPADSELQREVAVGLARLAEVQGVPGRAHVGEVAAARSNLERAERMLTATNHDAPDRWTWRRDLGQVRYLLALVYSGRDTDYERQLAMSRQAESDMLSALRDAQALGVGAQPLATMQETLTSIRLVQADAHKWLKSLDAAYRLQSGEEQRLQTLPADIRALMDFDYQAGRLALLSGDSLYYLDRKPEALAAYRRGAASFDKAVAEQPSNRKRLEGALYGHWYLASVRSELGDPVGALDDSDAAMRIVERLLQLDPENVEVRRLARSVSGDRAGILSAAGRHDEAIQLVESTLAAREARVAALPDDAEALRDLAVPLRALAAMHESKGDRAGACRVLTRAHEAWTRLDRRFGLGDFDRKNELAEIDLQLERCTVKPR